MRKLTFLMLAIVFTGCKSKQLLAVKDAENEISAQTIITNHYANKFDFSTLYIKANAKYSDENQSQSVTAEIKIKKDEKILVSVRVLGITVAKALITPNAVSYYEKPGGTYFEGDYEALSRWLGTDLDYNKVQNMLLGKALDDLTQSKYKASLENKLYKLENITDAKTQKSFYFEAEKFLARKQEVSQPEKARKLSVGYPEYQQTSDLFFPLHLTIEASQEAKNTTIAIEYKNITVNEEFSFPYSVPEGYERIFIN